MILNILIIIIISICCKSVDLITKVNNAFHSLLMQILFLTYCVAESADPRSDGRGRSPGRAEEADTTL